MTAIVTAVTIPLDELRTIKMLVDSARFALNDVETVPEARDPLEDAAQRLIALVPPPNPSEHAPH